MLGVETGKNYQTLNWELREAADNVCRVARAPHGHWHMTASIGRLKRWLFSTKTEKTAAVLAQVTVIPPESSDSLVLGVNPNV
jgi:hypothetical protein